MVWVAALCPRNQLRPYTFADVASHSRVVHTGEDATDVATQARSDLRAGEVCQMYEFPPQVGALESVSALPSPSPARPTPAEQWRHTFRAGCTVEEIRDAEQLLGVRIPPRWCDYLMSSSVFDSGWLPNGDYVNLSTPADAAEVTNAFYDWVPRCGAVMIGDADGTDWLQLDTRAGDDSPVVLLSSGGQAWEDTTVQANSIDEFIELIETGRFRFRYDSAAYEPG